MSQIPSSQLALKKRSTPIAVVDDSNKTSHQKPTKNGSSNGHKGENGNEKSDKDIILIMDDDYASIPVGRDEIVEEHNLSHSDETLPMKKKRGRKPKASTDSRESSEFSQKSEDVPKSNEQTPKKENEVPQVTNDDLQEAETLPISETKLLKLATDMTVSSMQRRSDRLQNASTIVNLSTVSTDLSTKVSNDTTMTIETPSTERKVSGRRSTRPIDDIKFTYRSPDQDESVANATFGSEIGDSLLETPLTDRKRRIDSVENIESPKRSRLDLSALFNNFYSPVTILRDKFRRTNLASTPKVGILDESANSIDTSASDMKEIDLNEKSEEKKELPEEEQSSVEGVKFIVKPAKKSTCSIM